MRVEFTNCSKYTSDRDPRVMVGMYVPTGTGFGHIGTTHTFWSRSLADQFVEEVGTDKGSPHGRAYTIAKRYQDASATKLTSAEIAWLCTPLADTPEEWMTAPAALKQETVAY